MQIMLFKCWGAIKKKGKGASLVVQWLRIHLLGVLLAYANANARSRVWSLANARSRVWSLVWEDPTCCRASKPVQQLLKPWASSPCSAREPTAEGSSCTTARGFLAAARGSPPTATKTQCSQKQINILKGWNIAICSNMDASREYQTKSDKKNMKSLICRI